MSELEQTRTVRRVGLVEDHESVAIGLAAMLGPEPDLELVAVAESVAGLLAETADLDLVVARPAPTRRVDAGGQCDRAA